ncbi:MAG: hypothetical protein NTV61_08715 [Candidatus Bathyarchaeota archaeon]|nr:hypothetical protein [Candidatus Bathyarchaeota archaeon]
MNATDLESWKITAIVLGVVSIVMFAIQRSSYMFLDPVFEFCIFHVPAVIAVGVYVYLRKKAPSPMVGV